MAAFLDKVVSHNVRIQQNQVACAQELASVLAYLLSCSSLSEQQGERRVLITNELLQKFMLAFQAHQSRTESSYEATS